jgi:ankyrin repeat protein
LAASLLRAGANPNVSTTHGTLLQQAIQDGHCSFARMLINRGAHVNDVAGENTCPPLCLSITRTKCTCGATCPVLTDLIAAGANVHAIHDQKAMIAWAVMHDSSQATHDLAALIAAGANVNDPACSTYDSLLHLAIASARVDKLEVLLEAGADPTTNSLVLFKHAIQYRSPATIRALFRAGACPHGECQDLTLLQYAVGHVPVYAGVACVQALLDIGVHVDAVSVKHPQPPLLIAVQRGHAECVQLLLRAGADFRTWAGALLEAAVRVGDKRPLDMLLEVGIDPDAPSSPGEKDIPAHAFE